MKNWHDEQVLNNRYKTLKTNLSERFGNGKYEFLKDLGNISLVEAQEKNDRTLSGPKNQKQKYWPFFYTIFKVKPLLDIKLCLHEV